jgi:hypothetical protein
VKNQSHSTDPFNGMTFTNIGRMNLGNLGHENCIEDKIIKRPALSIPSDHGSLPPIFSFILISYYLILFHHFFSSFFSSFSHSHSHSPYLLIFVVLSSHTSPCHLILICPMKSSLFIPPITIFSSLFVRSSNPDLSHFLILVYLILSSFCPFFTSLFVSSYHPYLSGLLILICLIFPS